MKVLIIGGTGNISSAISRMLLAQGVELTLFKRDARLPESLSGAKVICGDRTRREEFRNKLSQAGDFDCVIDMVCYEPEDAACAVEVFRRRVRQFIFCSTVDVYPKRPPSYPISESNTPPGASPSFSYGFKKMRCEEIFWRAQADHDFALTVMRPACTYNETWSPGVHAFGGQTYHLDRLRKGLPFILHGDGMSIWVATYRDDCAAAFANAVGNARAFGQAYNLTGDEWMTQERMWRTIAGLMGAPAPNFVYIPTDVLARRAPQEAEWCVENFQFNNIFDNRKAKQDLGFVYSVNFEAGARKCLDYLSAHNLIEDCSKHPFYDRIVERWQRLTAAMAQEPQAGQAE